MIVQGNSKKTRRDSQGGKGVSNEKLVEVFCPTKWTSLHHFGGAVAGRRLEEAKTFSVELRPYHDPMLPKSRDDVDMRILYKGAPFLSWRDEIFLGRTYCTQFVWEEYAKSTCNLFETILSGFPFDFAVCFLFHISWFLIGWKMMLPATVGWVHWVVFVWIKMKWLRKSPFCKG